MPEYFAWPGVVVVLSIFFMVMFRAPLIRFIDRAKKVTRGGVETGEPQAQLPAAAEKAAIAQFMATYDNALLREQEATIRDDLKQRGLTAPDAIEQALVRSLAGTYIQLHFEKVQSLIWASQVAALTWLNSRHLESEDELEKFYQGGKSRDPDFYNNYALHDWLGFMMNANFLRQDGARYGITVAGREFLKWRIDTGRAGPFFA
jgi:hypothetical protein